MGAPKYLTGHDPVLEKPEAYASISIGSCLLAAGISIAPGNIILGSVSATAGGIGIIYGLDRLIY